MQPRQPGRGRRWIKRIAIGLVAVFALAIAAGAIVTHTRWGRGLVRAQVEHQLAQTFVGGATLGGIEGNPFGELTLYDLVINGPDRRPAITVKKLVVEVGVLPLLSHQARVLAAHADGVDVDLRRDASGELEIKHLTRPGPPSAWSVQLPAVTVRHGHLRIDTGSEVMNFDDLAIDGWAKLPHGGPLDASLGVIGTWRERGAAALALHTVLHSDDEGLVVPALSARAGQVSVTGADLKVLKVAAGVAPGRPDEPARLPMISGTLTVDAAAAEVARLFPGVRLPGDIAVHVSAVRAPGQPWTALAIAGRLDDAPIRMNGTADLDGRRARGELSTGTLDITKLSGGKVAGRGAANAVFDVQAGAANALPTASATIHGWAAVADVPRTALDITLSSGGERAQARIDAHGEGVRAELAAGVRIAGQHIAIESATLHATTSDPARASGGKAPVHGMLNIDLKASGAVRPAPSLAVRGTIEGRRLRMQDLSVAALHVTVDAQRLPNRPLGTAHVQLVDLVRREMQLGELTVDATDRSDGKIAVAVRSKPKQNPWLADVDAVVTPPGGAGPGRVAIDLVRHHIRAGNGKDWTGHTGRLEISAERIALSDFTSAGQVGKLAISGSYERAGRRRGDITANVDVQSLSLDTLQRDYHGKLDAHVAATRRDGAWQGEAQLDGSGIEIDPSTPRLDTHAHVALHGRQLTVRGDAASSGLGSVQLALDVQTPPPAAIANPAAWKKLDRDAIRTAEVTLRDIEIRRAAELAGLAGEYAGRINGNLKLEASTIAGRIEATRVVTPSSRGLVANAVLELSQTTPTDLKPRLTITATDIGNLTAQADLEVPERWLDPVAWQRLGRGALHSANLRAEDIAIDPAMLDRLGIVTELHGTIGVAVDIGAAGRTAEATVDVAQLRGGPINQPVDLRLTTALGDRATTASFTAASKGGRLVELTGKMPLSLADLIDRYSEARRDPAALRNTPLTATAKLASVDAARLLAVFGRSEVTSGQLDGTVELAGTLARPTVTAQLVATQLKVPPGPRGKPVRTVERLAITGGWDGETAKLDIDGVESDGGTLKLAAVARPDALGDGTLTIKATRFDLVPVLVFAPGPAGGAAGELDADVKLTGLDPRTTQIAGELHMREARIPVAPAVGTLRSAKIDLAVADRALQIAVDGKLGAGTVKVTGSAALDGASPNGGKAKITLRKVSPIGTVEPQITADISASLTRERNLWRADLVVDRASVDVPSDRGEKLKPVGAPTDMYFANGERVTRRPMAQEEPVNPIFDITINLHSTRVESKEFRGDVRGRIEIRADGESVSLTGGIEAERGDLDLFGQRYYVERAGVNFDGSTDPLLDIRITHDFPDVTTVTVVHGRLSAPELMMSSDPGTYSQGQLLGFLLGGQPGGDPTGSSADRATSAGESYVANEIGGYVRKALPINLDVLRYEAATSSTSAAVIVGTWLSDALFLAYRQRLSARPDENTGEGEIEYWLTKRLVIEATAGNRNVDGLDLLWRKRY